MLVTDLTLSTFVNRKKEWMDIILPRMLIDSLLTNVVIFLSCSLLQKTKTDHLCALKMVRSACFSSIQSVPVMGWEVHCSQNTFWQLEIHQKAKLLHCLLMPQWQVWLLTRQGWRTAALMIPSSTNCMV